ncbi:MAG: carbamate kinase [Candidatus Saccharibacteria bacterium]|nr:carbamate kinase [Candidatus Saccharibacteria bacterium]
MARIVVALGGNALSVDGKASATDQQAVATTTAAELAKLVAAGHQLVVVHGNGPQIGNIILHEEAINTTKTPTMPIDTCGAMSQGQIGYWLQNALQNQLAKLHLKLPVASVVTQVLVDSNDPAFSNPTKPIGPFYDQAEAERLAIERQFTVKEDAGRGWRRVVPSPAPVDIIESDFIKLALNQGAIVVAAGGGGIPVYYQNDNLVGLEAVIDKDFAAAKLAEIISADLLLILTAVDHVKINFGKANEENLETVTVSQVLNHLAAGQFAIGSMLPKIEAATRFVTSQSGRTAIITSPAHALDSLSGQTGTTIIA